MNEREEGAGVVAPNFLPQIRAGRDFNPLTTHQEAAQFAIAVSRCKDALRADRRLARRFEVDDDAVAAAEDPANDPRAQLERRQMIADLERCLATLSSDARLAVLLRFQEQMSYEEMGARLDTKADTLQTRVTRAMPALRRCLQRRGWQHV